MSNKILKIIFLAIATLIVVPAVYANNLTVSNVVLGSRDPGTKTLVVNFDLQWENSWRNKINHDAIWLTVRLNDASSTPTNKKLCQISASGLNPSGSSTGSFSNLEFYVPADKNGVFLRRSVNGPVANVSTQNAQLTVSYDSCGFADSDQVAVSILGVEMVFIPQGAFYAGDNSVSVAALNQGSSSNQPWYINSENTISVSNPANGGFRYVSNNNPGEYATGSTFAVPALFPKGFNAFYAMKYEITEGQWVEFLNALPSAAARANRDLTNSNHKNSDSVLERNTIACSGIPISCSTTRPSRPVSYLSWMDLAAFLDWNALRPMSELEFEKISRGPVLPVDGEYVWGTTNIAAAADLSGSEDGGEIVITTGANAHFNTVTLTGGDADTGPLRAGIFATSSSSRESAGASYYGVLDLSGNLKEHVVTVGNASGLAFTGLNGDGALSNTAGFEGNADVNNWPGIDGIVGHGVTGADGSGFRGGSWADSAERLRISDRFEAALTAITAGNIFGGRGVRTYDGN